MSRLFLPLFLLLLLVLEGVALDFIPSQIIENDWILVAHWLFIFLVLMTLFYDLEHTYYSVLFAIIFGLMVDIVYTNVIGVYMFMYGFTIYFVHGMSKMLHTNFFVAFLLSAVGISVVDFGIYLIYSFIGISQMDSSVYFTNRLLPSLVANLIFFLILYVSLKKKMVKWSKERFDIKKS
ncbi:hypothetical protein GCM10011351_11470 [Paraliobacillus quinghaiensis]|uniref:Rod shape-determining protein MreD n=1 Tax=Paraliobacillus quinghaiensis TaxID=470815 RepID=A0A917WSC4_9BACI|nr:rod shape-determining protein MreD [Paraliobacillus quinghaiensis]GGM27342.1 hypothetical protein GCM10011351_11470 [Paraliobacillus quinghaiensis]